MATRSSHSHRSKNTGTKGRRKVHKVMKFFADSGWHVVEAKYGHLLQAAFARAGALHDRRLAAHTPTG